MSVNAQSPALAGWLTLQSLPLAGGRARLDLLDHFGSLDALLGAGENAWRRALPHRTQAVAALSGGLPAEQLERTRQWLSEDASHHLVVWDDPDYPSLLREIPDPPAVLHVVGDRSLLARPQLAIVGSRNATPAGLDHARQFAHALAQAGLVVTSGLALGIDGAAHRGALDAQGATIAVCGTGLDRVYPARHRALAHEIAEHGALVSEFLLGTPPEAEHFPIRNRLISGLALGTLVVEAALKSGSLITARLANEQGREVFAIPGSIHSPQARGCHALIRQGAKLVETAQDIVEELGALASFALTQTSPAEDATVKDMMGELPKAAHRTLDSLGFDPATFDELVERSGLTASDVSSMLVVLELKGLVASIPGGRFQRMPGQRSGQ